jgi:hypothetical protein
MAGLYSVAVLLQLVAKLFISIFLSSYNIFFTSAYSCKYLVKCVRYPKVYLLNCYLKVLSFEFLKEVLHFATFVVRDLKLVKCHKC